MSRTLVRKVLPLGEDAVGVFYSPSRPGKYHLKPNEMPEEDKQNETLIHENKFGLVWFGLVVLYDIFEGYLMPNTIYKRFVSE